MKHQKITKVFQMSFDIGTSDIGNSQDVADLYREIEHLIENYRKISQEPLHFISVGCFNRINMDHVYTKDILAELNQPEPISEFKAIYNPYTRELAVKYGDYVTEHTFDSEEEWTKASYNGDDEHPNYLHIQLDYDECCQLLFYPRVDNSDSLNEDLCESFRSNKNWQSDCIKIIHTQEQWDLEYLKL